MCIVFVSVFILRAMAEAFRQCSVPLCQLPREVALESALLTDALILLSSHGGCKCGRWYDRPPKHVDTTQAVKFDRLEFMPIGPPIRAGEKKPLGTLHNWRHSNAKATWHTEINDFLV